MEWVAGGGVLFGGRGPGEESGGLCRPPVLVPVTTKKLTLGYYLCYFFKPSLVPIFG